MEHYLVTGATGFVGRAVLRALRERGAEVTALVRASGTEARQVDVPAIPVSSDFAHIGREWPADLRTHCVLHLAARVHVMDERAVNPLAAFRATNVTGTLNLASAAARAGVSRFVYVSSIKAAGESEQGHPLREDDPARPADPYGQSKYEAEQMLFEFGHREGLEVVVLRPPLVYGPGVKANFFSLMAAVARGMPLPLRYASAPRSLIGADNLVSSILVAASHPAAAGQVFHVSDGHDVGVDELTRLLGQALGCRARLLPVPVGLLRLAGTITGRSEVVQRLIDPLRVDPSKIKALLGWQAPFSLQEGLAQTADWYRSLRR
ncbi:NAD-dependent epimerase/dehydratase family protein [Ralstonia sp. ASV6]|uniref:NAD-dependent epimerase/dehydratase family protein n=1 Tax=Ralstonia sp. ASV6 TaxID=2795124 RepID=UPI0018EBF18C|nr:NAD-dependent epimerase/dehydratase family protein [Ralstonia sp. ASV6]